MNPLSENPRSELHSLQPIGQGTSEVESLRATSAAWPYPIRYRR